MPRSARKNIKKSRPSLGLVALLLLLFLVFISKALGIIGDLGKPYSADSLTQKTYGWNGEGAYNLVVKSDTLYFLSLDPVKRSLNIIKVPEELYVGLPLGFGSWPIRSVYQLGQAEKPAIGADLVKRTFSSVFGLPADGYLIYSSDKPLEKIVEELRQNPLTAFGLLKQSKADLSLGEYSRFIWTIKNLRADKIKITNLDRSEITSWSLLPDGSRALTLDRFRWDEFTQDNLQDAKLLDEGLTVGIFNGTEHAGLAEKAGRLITNLGGRVIFTTNFPVKVHSSLVFGNSNSYTYKRLAEVFAPNCQKKEGLAGLFQSKLEKCRLVTGEIDSSRADINIVVGEDYFLTFNRPETN